MARDASRALGDPPGAVDARLAMAVRPLLLCLQLGDRGTRVPRHPVDRRRAVGTLLRDPRQYLDRRAFLYDHVPCGAEVGSGRALRGGGDRWRDLVAEALVHYASDD